MSADRLAALESKVVACAKGWYAGATSLQTRADASYNLTQAVRALLAEEARRAKRASQKEMTA